MTSERRMVLDLFSGLGGFSSAFEESDGWDVVTVDIEGRFDPDIRADVLDLRPSHFDGWDFDVILAGPPCGVFTHAHNGHHIKDGDPVTSKAREHVAMVYHTLGLIEALTPDYWFLENPRGNLASFIGPPTGYVTYCQYGADYMKPTHLWGHHPPMAYRACQFGADCHESNTEHDGRSADNSLPLDRAERAKVPYDLSLAIREAIETAYANPPPEQVDLFSLTEVSDRA